MLKQNTPSYEITPLTMAILAHEDEYGNFGTWILEEQSEYFVNRTPSKIIDYACRFFGSSLKGRQEGTKDICGITHKAPISIDPSSGMYFFPTFSPMNTKCSWISHSHIEQVNPSHNQRTQLLFTNGKQIFLDISFGSMLNQIQRTAQFRYLLDNRIKFLMKHKQDSGFEFHE
ncbi:MAG TPA: competence protein ComK [Bacillota bacterium]|nr:competence protein ComK [Bacillota bacterium]